MSILSKLYRYGQLNNEVFLKIFDTKVLPVLTYGSEIWGIDYQLAVERVQYYACKRYMCVKLNSSNDAVMAESGRFPLYINAAKRCIRFWFRILNMQEHRYVKKCYLMLKCYAEAGVSNWASGIRNLLYMNGFGHIWENQGVANENHFIVMFIQRMKDPYL